jgi:hypothetical protein
MLRHELHDARQIVPAHKTVQYDEALRMAALKCRKRLIEIVRPDHPDRLKDHAELWRCLLDVLELERHPLQVRFHKTATRERPGTASLKS